MSVGDDSNYRLIRSIVRNCRLNISSIAREAGIHYVSVKKKIDRLNKRGLLEVKPLVSTKLSGSIGALVRMKTKNRSKVLEILSRCNRVLGVMEIDEEVIALIHGRSKIEVLEVVNRVSMMGDGLEEFSIEYGRLPHSLMVPIKSADPCIASLLGGIECSNCLPSLSLRGNGLKNSGRARKNRL